MPSARVHMMRMNTGKLVYGKNAHITLLQGHDTEMKRVTAWLDNATICRRDDDGRAKQLCRLWQFSVLAAELLAQGSGSGQPVIPALACTSHADSAARSDCDCSNLGLSLKPVCGCTIIRGVCLRVCAHVRVRMCAQGVVLLRNECFGKGWSACCGFIMMSCCRLFCVLP